VERANLPIVIRFLALSPRGEGWGEGAFDASRFMRIGITPEVLTLIAEIDEFKGAWKALSTLAPERLAALRRQNAQKAR
jgi:hypothetical protein